MQLSLFYNYLRLATRAPRFDGKKIELFLLRLTGAAANLGSMPAGWEEKFCFVVLVLADTLSEYCIFDHFNHAFSILHHCNLHAALQTYFNNRPNCKLFYGRRTAHMQQLTAGSLVNQAFPAIFMRF
jgi:hypothetical protein